MKKIILLVILLTCFSIQASAAVTHVASGNGFCSAAGSAGNISSTCGGAVTTKTFTYTANAANNAVAFAIGCAATTAPTITLAATGWSFTTLKVSAGASGGWQELLGAIAPNTTAATVTITSSVSCAGFINDLEEEFSGNDTTGGTTTFDASNSGTGSGSCSITVTPANNNDGMAGFCNDTVTAAGSCCTLGANDTSGDRGEWAVLSGGSGVAQTVAFTGSGSWIEDAVTIKPSGGGAAATGINIQRRYEKFELINWKQK